MTKIQVRRDTSTNWSVNNPIPAQGEPCYETDTGKLKIGDGSNTYTNLPYIEGGGSPGGDVTQAGDNTFTGTNAFTSGLWLKNTFVNAQQQLYLNNNKSLVMGNKVQIGDIEIDATSTTDNKIQDGFTGKYYLTQDQVVPGDNVTIEETTKGLKISATGGGTATVSDNGIRGDYESRYGIISSPNGILTDSQDAEGNLILTLHQGLVMQCAGQDSKTMISADTTHTVESTTEFDLFYAAGAFYEAAEVVFSETEPAGSDTGITAWFNPNKTANPDQKWKFKSNTNGNTWASAAAGRIAHIHTNGTAITRIDYAGCRIVDGQHFLSAAEAAHAAMPSKKYIDIVLGASGATYTAPADGFYMLRLPSTSAQGTYMDANLKLDGILIGTATYIISFVGDTCSIFMRAPKNSILQLGYTLTFGTGAVFRFIYANGSAPED